MRKTLPPCPFDYDVPNLGRAHLLRVDPVEPVTADPMNPGEPDQAIWLAQVALGNRTHKTLRSVWRTFCELAVEDHPAVLLMWCLWHPQTPFALAYKPDWVHPLYNYNGSRCQMHVLYRGYSYVRTEDGVLHPVGTDFNEYWPTPEEMGRMWRAANEWSNPAPNNDGEGGNGPA